MAEPLHNNEELLMRYLDGEMEPSERADFETRLQNDASLKAQLENLQLAIASVKQYATAQKVQSIHIEMMQELSSVRKEETKIVPMRKIIRYGLAIAASVIIILVGVNIFSSPSLSSEKLYNEAYVDFDASASRNSGATTEITQLYQAHNYKSIAEKSNTAKLSQQDSLLVGLSYLKLDQAPTAIQWLRSISTQNVYRQDADFYTALAYVRNKNYNEAISLIQKIHSDPTHIYHGQFSDDYIDKLKKLASK